MAGITLLQAQTQLDAHLAALSAALSSQRYKINDRELQRAPLEQIQAGIEFWNRQVMQLTSRANGRSRARTVVVG
jgi:hypothetical protein